MPLRAAACLHLHPTHCSQMFDSLQRNIAGTAASTATIGGKVAVAFIAAAISFFDDFVLPHAILLLRGVLTGDL